MTLLADILLIDFLFPKLILYSSLGDFYLELLRRKESVDDFNENKRGTNKHHLLGKKDRKSKFPNPAADSMVALQNRINLLRYHHDRIGIPSGLFFSF